jgi:hypothetical protein
MVALKHLKRSNMFRSIFQIVFSELVLFLFKSMIKTGRHAHTPDDMLPHHQN